MRNYNGLCFTHLPVCDWLLLLSIGDQTTEPVHCHFDRELQRWREGRTLHCPQLLMMLYRVVNASCQSLLYVVERFNHCLDVFRDAIPTLQSTRVLVIPLSMIRRPTE